MMLALMAGCAHQEGTITRAPASYFVFVGSPDGSVCTLDGKDVIIDKANAKDHFEVAPGAHRITVRKQGLVVVDREILTADRQTVEVTVP